jgi:hypothetical protein
MIRAGLARQTYSPGLAQGTDPRNRRKKPAKKPAKESTKGLTQGSIQGIGS